MFVCLTSFTLFCVLKSMPLEEDNMLVTGLLTVMKEFLIVVIHRLCKHRAGVSEIKC